MESCDYAPLDQNIMDVNLTEPPSQKLMMEIERFYLKDCIIDGYFYFNSEWVGNVIHWLNFIKINYLLGKVSFFFYRQHGRNSVY